MKIIEQHLKMALLNGGTMLFALYESELARIVADLQAFLLECQDEFIFAVVESNGDVAMMLIESHGQVYINEAARDRLQMLWRGTYRINISKLIPVFAGQLRHGQIPVSSVHDGSNGKPE